jgi:hypothetical protein
MLDLMRRFWENAAVIQPMSLSSRVAQQRYGATFESHKRPKRVVQIDDAATRSRTTVSLRLSKYICAMHPPCDGVRVAPGPALFAFPSCLFSVSSPLPSTSNQALQASSRSELTLDDMDTERRKDELPRSPIRQETELNNGEEHQSNTMQTGHPARDIDRVLHTDIPSRTPPKIGADIGTTIVSKTYSSSTDQTKLPESGRTW